MKGLLAGLLLWVLITSSVPGGALAGLVVGALAAYIIWRLDAFDRRLKRLENGPRQTTAIPADAALDALLDTISRAPHSMANRLICWV